jgi:hypothetical protein
MARLRQQNPQNYGSSSSINAEFENITRYINAGELGDKTVGELLAILFDINGEFAGPIELRNDSSAGIQYRVGTYSDTTTGWITLATLAELRGADGSTAGDVGAPIFHARQDSTATNAQTVFDYAHVSTDTLLVYVDGVLKREGGSNDYTSSTTAGSASTGAVTFNSGQSTDAKITIFKVRSTSVTGYTRTDTLTTESTSNFPFTHDTDTKLQVYKNGLLQREGGSFDYTSIPSTNIVQFNSAVASGNLVTIITVENVGTTAVSGLMLEGTFTDTATGKIPYSKISIADADLTTAKVSGLATTLSTAAKLTSASSSPAGPATGDLWLDTSQSPNKLKFYDGTQFLETSPASSLPTFATANASQYVRVNATGTALEYGTVDLSSVIAVTQKGAASGVASLDSSGRLPFAQLPTVLATDTFYDTQTTVADATVTMKRLWKQKVQIDGLALRTASGTCTFQINAGGVDVGSTYSVSSTPNEITLGTPVQIDASTASKTIGYTITSNSSGASLEVSLAVSVIT